jgi:hypothetical protein
MSFHRVLLMLLHCLLACLRTYVHALLAVSMSFSHSLFSFRGCVGLIMKGDEDE